MLSISGIVDYLLDALLSSLHLTLAYSHEMYTAFLTVESRVARLVNWIYIFVWIYSSMKYYKVLSPTLQRFKLCLLLQIHIKIISPNETLYREHKNRVLRIVDPTFKSTTFTLSWANYSCHCFLAPPPACVDPSECFPLSLSTHISRKARYICLWLSLDGDGDGHRSSEYEFSTRHLIPSGWCTQARCQMLRSSLLLETRILAR